VTAFRKTTNDVITFRKKTTQHLEFSKNVSIQKDYNIHTGYK